MHCRYVIIMDPDPDGPPPPHCWYNMLAADCWLVTLKMDVSLEGGICKDRESSGEGLAVSCWAGWVDYVN